MVWTFRESSPESPGWTPRRESTEFPLSVVRALTTSGRTFTPPTRVVVSITRVVDMPRTLFFFLAFPPTADRPAAVGEIRTTVPDREVQPILWYGPIRWSNRLVVALV